MFVAAVRALVSGALIYGVARARGAERPARGQWRSAAIVGVLLLLGGNGLVTTATQWVASSVCALIVAMLPVWMVVLDRASPARRSRLTWIGVAMGMGGVSLLIGPRAMEAWRGGTGHESVMRLVGMGLLLCSSLCWASGSLYSRRAERAKSAFAGTGMQLICGGAALLIVSVATGEPGRMSMDTMFGSWRPGLSLAYLTVFGTLLGYTAYIWLLDVASPVLVASYAWVNPVVAVVLGAWLGGEAISGRVGVAAAVIVAGVAVIVMGGRRRGR
jgi:drug/metabolite transporter (DMT)-like permease